MAREDLRPHLTLALRTAVQTGKAAGRPQVRIEADGVVTHVDLRVLPVTPDPATDPAARLFLVVFQETTAAAEPRPADPQGGAAAGQVAALREELREKESYLRSVNTDLQSTNERLTSANEEMQSLNEELQSANEELETSKEEMQSLNEELATVNAELQNRVSDLSRSNNDMLNLLAGTGIATVFLDPQLRILRFTPSASAIINLIPADVGRPVAHLVSNLVNYDRLVADAQAVLATLEPRSAEVQTRAGAWYAMQVQPYRTLDNTIEGTVITFVDITGTVRARETLKQVNSLLRLAVVVRESPDALTVQALDGRLLAWNQAATALYGWSEAEALAMNTRERIPPEEQAAAAAVLEQLLRGETLAPFNARRRSKSGAAREVSVVATALRDEAGRIDAIATRERSAVPSPAGPGGAR
jgi:two-component system CheB/CheR fusion protein